jgi:RHS repeat-associated protein
MIAPGFSRSCCFCLSDLLNQYTEREYPGALDARGVADAGFTVDVNGVPATRTGADYYGVDTFNNSSGAVLGELEIEITDPGPPPVPQPTEVYSLATTGRTDPYVIPETPEEFAYDLDGNLISDGRWDYVWDGENRLISMTIRAQVVTDTAMTRQRMLFDYDSAGRRIRSRTEEYVSSSWVPVSEVRYLYDGWNVVAELDAMGVTRSMTWGLDLSGTEQGAGGVGGLLWTVDDNDDGMIPGYDGNGNIIAWVDASDGSLAGTREYGAFGEDVTFTGVAHEIPFGFSTKYQDSLSGLYYYGYRYYNTSTGRWLSRDPLGERGGLNLYGFVGNNAINYVDVLGLEKRKCTSLVLAGHTSEVRDRVDELAEKGFKPRPGDRIGCVSCFQDSTNRHVENIFPGHSIDKFPRPESLLWPDNSWKRPEDGRKASEALELAIEAAKKDAEKRCKEDGCPCKSIRVKIECRGKDFKLVLDSVGKGDLCGMEIMVDCN